MLHKNKVIRSVNLAFEPLCVDIFCRADGTYGFDEFRRDPEDGRGWYSVSHYSSVVFPDYETALAAATAQVAWLASQL
jgi:hypothetical protein